jgi:periplasmic divalent cation tolerance protein
MAASMKSSMSLVRTTVGSRDAADILARHLVNAGLAACVHIQEIRSIYRWQGKVEEQAEWLVEARALESRAVAVREAMLADHSYQLPLVETLTATGISKEYLDWARSA